MTHISELTLKNFRGVREMALNLHDKMNIFVGVNGAGKSTILDATAFLLSRLVNRIKTTDQKWRRFTKADIRNGESNANIGIKLQCENYKFEWSIDNNKYGHQAILKGKMELATRLKEKISSTDGKTNVPIFVHYLVTRAVLEIPLKINKKSIFDTLSTFDGAFTGGANFRVFFEWFRQREDLENENKVINNRNYSDQQLESVRQALKVFLPDFDQLSVRRSPLRMEIEKRNGEKVEKLIVNQLSDGEKCLLALIGDIARRLAIANPQRKNPLHGEGVILIDEIDLHLHPQWQRMLLPRLPEVFPNCQFLISTHSPHVITHAQIENLFLLKSATDGIQVERPSAAYGQTVERILEDLMGLENGTRPQKITEELENLFDQIGMGKIDAAKILIANLRKKIGADPDLSKAEVLIRRREVIGK